jgi:hypothetical protein
MIKKKSGRKTFAEPLTVPVVDDDLDAVKLISAIVGQFSDADKNRIIRWVMEKFNMGGDVAASAAVNVPVAESRIIIPPMLRNPHLMSKPPLNRVIVQDDDDDGAILGIPADRDVPEPPEAEILKPHKETRRLEKVTDVHKGKDGKVITSTSFVMRQ